MFLLSVPVLLAAGCTTHYQITDPATGSVYYTTSVNKKAGGAVEFQDAKTGADVTIQNSEITEISAEEYQRQTEDGG
jgi:hypothetical protein